MKAPKRKPELMNRIICGIGSETNDADGNVIRFTFWTYPKGQGHYKYENGKHIVCHTSKTHSISGAPHKDKYDIRDKVLLNMDFYDAGGSIPYLCEYFLRTGQKLDFDGPIPDWLADVS